MHRFLHAVCCLLAIVMLASSAQAEMEWRQEPGLKSPTPPQAVTMSADGKRTFILGQGGKVYVYDDQEALQLTIKVDPATTSIAASPEGDKLFAVSPKASQVQQYLIETVVDIDVSRAPFQGQKNAPVTLVVFSDFECPYCSRVKPLLDVALKNNPDTLKIAFIHYPLPMHKTAIPAALSAIAAQNQGKFWQYHDLLFDHQKELNQERTEGFAQQLGLDMKRFRTDMMSPETKQRLAHDMQAARKAGVRGTPALFVNGRPVTERSPAGIQKLIDRELARLNKQPAK